ncbi:hypothetical protein C8Q80DRAFT_1274154 [Daedaleopsis nitida]|nr:hypothetical protein C8Q80DRAFT_1274154 [Daedaleopsis nitida]
MFACVSTIVALVSLAVLAAAVPYPSGYKCSTSSIQCYNTVASANDPEAKSALSAREMGSADRTEILS